MSVITRRIPAPDGTPLAVHEVGNGRPVLLLHGLFSDAHTNWIRFGHAERVAAAGSRVLMPDARAHGASGAPHDPACYPPDVLLDDVRFLIAELGLTDFDLGGFSLGARTVARLLEQGLRPRRAVLAGMGREGLSGWNERRGFFVDAIDRRDTVTRGEPHYLAVQFLKTQGVDPVAARLLLESFRDEGQPGWSAMTPETLVVCGTEDRDNGSAAALADALPNARYVPIPGTHMSSVTKPELGEAIAEFLMEGQDVQTTPAWQPPPGSTRRASPRAR